jgi:hypothetical protein
METTPDTNTPVKEHVRSRFLIPILVALGVILVVAFVANIIRERIKDDAVRANLESITAQARIFRAAYGTFSKEEVTDCQEGVFSDPTIQAALIAIRLANGRGEEQCLSASDKFFLAVSRPSRGFYRPDSTYWCADARGKVCPLDSLLPIPETCECP